jgi:hypothetical protein
MRLMPDTRHRGYLTADEEAAARARSRVGSAAQNQHVRADDRLVGLVGVDA